MDDLLFSDDEEAVPTIPPAVVAPPDVNRARLDKLFASCPEPAPEATESGSPSGSDADDDIPFLARDIAKSVAENCVTPGLLHVARSEFNIQDFREGQLEAVLATIRGESALAVLPTGWGKSLCYQLAARALRILADADGRSGRRPRGHVCIVVSPLLALVQDQLESIARQGVLSAYALSGQTSTDHMDKVLGLLEHDSPGAVPMDVLFVSPERLVGNARLHASLRRALHRIGFVCFDEAHCVCEWSHDFRPSFMYCQQRLRQIAADAGVPAPPVLALTATAPAAIVSQLKGSLGVSKTIVCDDPRPNLRFVVRRREDSADGVGELSDSAQWRGFEASVHSAVAVLPSPMLLYVGTQREADMLAAHLRSHFGDTTSGPMTSHKKSTGALFKRDGKRQRSELGDHEVLEIVNDGPDAVSEQAQASPASPPLVIRAYHAGLEPSERRMTQRMFMRGEVSVMVATVAFGMGINKADVRTVLHTRPPSRLEAYLQESGRAGRDGEPATCALLYAPSDYHHHYRRLLCGLLAPPQLRAAVSAVLKSPMQFPNGDRYSLLCCEHVAGELQCSVEAVETILFLIAVHHPHALRIVGVAPQRAYLSGTKADATGGAAQAPQRATVAEARRQHRQAARAGTTEVHAMLGIADPVLQQCLRCDKLQVLEASLHAGVAPVEFVERVQQHQAARRLRVRWASYGYLLHITDVSLSEDANSEFLAKEMLQRQRRRIDGGVQQLRDTFSVFDAAAIEQARPDALPQALPPSAATATAAPWTPPAPTLTKSNALDVIGAFFHRHAESVSCDIEAAKALTGAVPRVHSESVGSHWHGSPYYGKLAGFEFEWVRKACSLHTPA